MHVRPATSLKFPSRSKKSLRHAELKTARALEHLDALGAEFQLQRLCPSDSPIWSLSRVSQNRAS
jgi:hypothetical protein